MTEEQAQQMIDLLTILNGYGEQAVFLVHVAAGALVLRVGQGLADRILWSKNSKRIW